MITTQRYMQGDAVSASRLNRLIESAEAAHVVNGGGFGMSPRGQMPRIPRRLRRNAFPWGDRWSCGISRRSPDTFRFYNLGIQIGDSAPVSGSTTDVTMDTDGTWYTYLQYAVNTGLLTVQANVGSGPDYSDTSYIFRELYVFVTDSGICKFDHEVIFRPVVPARLAGA